MIYPANNNRNTNVAEVSNETKLNSTEDIAAVSYPVETIETIDTEKVIYKVQVGAFTNPVDEKKFHGLGTISVDKNDEKVYSKYMVGIFYSYNAASEAKRIIAGTTDYSDAFIVSYKGESRVPVIKDCSRDENMAQIKK